MSNDRTPHFAECGKKTDTINVLLSYRIVDLFSEGLYSSPNKAIEELVTNSFDAGAQQVHVVIPPNLHHQAATIVVVDDGEGMDAEGLKNHWLIGLSKKRSRSRLPRGRDQIGKFGIGKLATYVLANRLTHITKQGKKFFSTSMNFRAMNESENRGVETTEPIQLDLRELSQEEAKKALATWTNSQAFQKADMKLFGRGASEAWTVAIMSSLKDKAHEIQLGRLKWILQTALPLRDDFRIWLNGQRLRASRANRGLIKRWVLGKDIEGLPKPCPDSLRPNKDSERRSNDPKQFGLTHPDLGRITGYAEAYENLLTAPAKSDLIGRSHGFFVYVLDRLVNVDDGHFGISPDELRHGSFGRFRLVVHMDGLDNELRASRETMREGPLIEEARNILRATFNYARKTIEHHDAQEKPGAKLDRRLASSPASLSRRPILLLARAVLDGKFRSRFLSLPRVADASERDQVLGRLENRIGSGKEFVTGLDFSIEGSIEDRFALYDVETGALRINCLHPFVGAFLDEFHSQVSGQPLELFAMAEVLLEAHLFESGLKAPDIERVLEARDMLLRYLAQASGRRSAWMTSQALHNARNNSNELEVELVEAFRSLGFEATRVGKSGNPDGIATAYLPADENGLPRRYKVSLEAKSTQTAGKKVAAATVKVSTVARHRDKFQCDHAVVVAPAFQSGSALASEITADNKASEAQGTNKTITLITVDDLARLVRIRPLKRLSLGELRDLFVTCRLVEHSAAWVDKLTKKKVPRPQYEQIVHVIHDQQRKFGQCSVTYGALRVALSVEDPPIIYTTDEELKALCVAMGQMAPGDIIAAPNLVELHQSPENALATLKQATSNYPLDEQQDIIVQRSHSRKKGR